MFRFVKELCLEEVIKRHPEVFAGIRQVHEDTALSEEARQAALLNIAQTMIMDCRDADVDRLENSIHDEWPKIAPNTIIQETIIFWLMWRYISIPLKQS